MNLRGTLIAQALASKDRGEAQMTLAVVGSVLLTKPRVKAGQAAAERGPSAPSQAMQLELSIR